ATPPAAAPSHDKGPELLINGKPATWIAATPPPAAAPSQDKGPQPSSIGKPASSVAATPPPAASPSQDKGPQPSSIGKPASSVAATPPPAAAVPPPHPAAEQKAARAEIPRTPRYLDEHILKAAATEIEPPP